jgi:chaperonin cofactor prefoldin
MQQQVDDLEHRLAACQGQADATRTLVTDLKKIHDVDITTINNEINVLKENQNKIMESIDSLFTYVLQGGGQQP